MSLLNQQGWEISSANHGAKHWKILFFCIISTTLTKAGGGGTGCLFYRKTLQVSNFPASNFPRKLEHKLQAAVPVLCWCFFNLTEKTIVKKKQFFIFNS